jgi:hypothetical protein
MRATAQGNNEVRWNHRVIMMTVSIRLYYFFVYSRWNSRAGKASLALGDVVGHGDGRGRSACKDAVLMEMEHGSASVGSD